MTVDGFVLEYNYISYLWWSLLFLPGDGQPPPGVFLFPEGVEDVEGDFPPGKLMLYWCVWVDLVSVAFLEPLENVVGGEGDSQRSTED